MPPAPELKALTSDQWRNIEAPTRDALTSNLTKLLQYTYQLEAEIRMYEEWRTGRGQ